MRRIQFIDVSLLILALTHTHNVRLFFSIKPCAIIWKFYAYVWMVETEKIKFIYTLVKCWCCFYADAVVFILFLVSVYPKKEPIQQRMNIIIWKCYWTWIPNMRFFRQSINKPSSCSFSSIYKYARFRPFSLCIHDFFWMNFHKTISIWRLAFCTRNEKAVWINSMHYIFVCIQELFSPFLSMLILFVFHHKFFFFHPRVGIVHLVAFSILPTLHWLE